MFYSASCYDGLRIPYVACSYSYYIQDRVNDVRLN